MSSSSTEIHLTGDEITTGDTPLSCLWMKPYVFLSCISPVRCTRRNRSRRSSGKKIVHCSVSSVPKYPKVIQQSMFNVFLFVFVPLHVFSVTRFIFCVWAVSLVCVAFSLHSHFGTLPMCLTHAHTHENSLFRSSFLKVKSLSKYPVFFSLLSILLFFYLVDWSLPYWLLLLPLSYAYRDDKISISYQMFTRMCTQKVTNLRDVVITYGRNETESESVGIQTLPESVLFQIFSLCLYWRRIECEREEKIWKKCMWFVTLWRIIQMRIVC